MKASQWRIPGGILLGVLGVIPAVHAATTFSLISGGGINASANRDDFYQELLSVQNTLAEGKGRIMAAGGKGSLMAQTLPATQPGESVYVRDAAGEIVLIPLTDDVEAVSKKGIESLFQDIRKNKPEKATFFFGDHGSPDGMYLWQGEMLSRDELWGMQRLASKKTLVRSIHSHCFSGVMVKPPKPKNKSELKAKSDVMMRLQESYPVNHCGLATSDVMETANSELRGQNWKETELTRFLSENPQASLADLKAYYSGKEWSTSTPVSTSDFLVEELLDFACGKSQHAQPAMKVSDECPREDALPAPELQKETASRIQTVQGAFYPEVCRSDHKGKVDHVAQRLQGYFDRHDQAADMRNRVSMAYVKSKQPEVWVEYDKAVQEQKLVMSDKEAPSGRNNKQLKAVIEKFKPLAEEALRDPQIKTVLKSGCTPSVVADSMKSLPELNAGIKTADCTAIIAQVDREYVAYQGERKRYMARVQAERKAFLESFLSQPGYERIRDHYEKIKACENAPLR